MTNIANMTGLQAASLYLAIQMILVLVLAYRVVQKRRAGISLGDGGELSMQRTVRIHGNLTEYAPMFFLGLFALAGLGGPVIAIHGFGAVFTLARFAHAFNFFNKEGVEGIPKGRFLGTLFSWISILFLALTLLYFVLAG